MPSESRAIVADTSSATPRRTARRPTPVARSRSSDNSEPTFGSMQSFPPDNECFPLDGTSAWRPREFHERPASNTPAMDPAPWSPDDRPVLVAGATGYVGGRLIPELLADGAHVRALARRPRKLEGRPFFGHPQ